MIAVRISRRAAERIRAGHCWVYAGEVTDRAAAAPGDLVRVLDERGRPLGLAHFSSTSQITLRFLSTRQEPVGPEFFSDRIRAAADLRRRLVTGADAFRMVHAEGDLLPGLIIDRYARWLVVQTLSQGMDRSLAWILDACETLAAPAGILLRNDAAVRAKEALPLEVRVARGHVPETVEIELNGFRLEANLHAGQKTGIYLDQRENYLAAARYAFGQALDCFTSTGGFALHLAARCERVEAADSSEAALAIARRNAAANGIGNVEWREADVFDLLAGHAAARRHFDTVVLDPPAFAKSRANRGAALRAYKDLNLRALRLLGPGGVLITCSCSFHTSEADLLEAVAAAALDSGKTLRVLERRTQSCDHPILLTVPETHYLKCLILQVV